MYIRVAERNGDRRRDRQTLDLTTLAVSAGDTFAVEVTPSDSTLTGELFTSNTVTATSVNPIVIS